MNQMIQKLALLILLVLPTQAAVAGGGLIGGCVRMVEALTRLLAAAGTADPEKVIATLPNDPLLADALLFQNEVSSAAFAKHPKLILRAALDISGGAFPVSNEYDFFKTPIDYTATDVVIGFATNSAWDIAVRKNAKILLLADWQDTPLQGQEFLFRPWILTSRNRTEFLAMMAGVPLPEEMARQPLDVVMDYLEAYPTRSHSSADISQRMIYMRSVLERIRGDSRFSEEHIRFIARYYHHLLVRDHSGQAKGAEDSADVVMKFLSQASTERNVAGPFRGPRIEVIANDLYHHFYERYHPRLMVAAGATVDELNTPFHNILSSEDSFGRLQRLFVDGVFYAQASLFNPALWAAAKKLGQGQGMKSFTASISNIVDCSYGGCHAGPGTVRAALTLITKSLGTPTNPVVVFQTRQSGMPYQYERFEFGKPDDVVKEMKRAGYSPEEITARAVSKAQQVQRLLLANEPTVLEVRTEWIQLKFGEKLGVRFHRPQNGTGDFRAEFGFIEGDDFRIVFFDIPEDYIKAYGVVLTALGKIREVNPDVNRFIDFYSKPPEAPQR